MNGTYLVEKEAGSKMLILVAIEDELKRSDLPDHKIEYIGVGKVNAVFSTLNAIKKHSPKQIINFGTAGSLDAKIKGLVEVSTFFQRDMDASPLGFKVGQTPFEEDIEITFGREGVHVAQAISLLPAYQL